MIWIRQKMLHHSCKHSLETVRIFGYYSGDLWHWLARHLWSHVCPNPSRRRQIHMYFAEDALKLICANIYH